MRLVARLATVLSWATMAVLVCALGPLPMSFAEVTAACSATDPSFCVSYSLDVTTPGSSTDERTAAAPADLTLVISNSSPDHTLDSDRWASSVTITALRTPGGAPALTPSSRLPDGLVLSDSPSGCSPADGYVGCGAGHGSVLVTAAGFTRLTSFGVLEVTNVNPPDEGSSVAYEALVQVCVPTPFSDCSLTDDVALPLTDPASGTGNDSGLTMPVSGTFPTAIGDVDYALDSLVLHLDGTSDRLDSGPAEASYDVLRLPLGCGVVGADGRITDRAGDSVTVAEPVTIEGCPTMTSRTARGIAPYRARLDVTATAGARSIDHYVWDFGDGSRRTTDDPSATHAWARTWRKVASRTVTVRAVDVAGARSDPEHIHLTGSALGLSAPRAARRGARIVLSGELRGGESRLGGRRVTILACAKSGGGCHRVARTRTLRRGADRGSYRVHVRLRRTTTWRVDFSGGHALLGVSARHRVHAR